MLVKSEEETLMMKKESTVIALRDENMKVECMYHNIIPYTTPNSNAVYC